MILLLCTFIYLQSYCLGFFQDYGYKIFDYFQVVLLNYLILLLNTIDIPNASPKDHDTKTVGFKNCLTQLTNELMHNPSIDGWQQTTPDLFLFHTQVYTNSRSMYFSTTWITAPFRYRLHVLMLVFTTVPKGDILKYGKANWTELNNFFSDPNPTQFKSISFTSNLRMGAKQLLRRERALYDHWLCAKVSAGRRNIPGVMCL